MTAVSLLSVLALGRTFLGGDLPGVEKGFLGAMGSGGLFVGAVLLCVGWIGLASRLCGEKKRPQRSSDDFDLVHENPKMTVAERFVVLLPFLGAVLMGTLLLWATTALRNPPERLSSEVAVPLPFLEALVDRPERNHGVPVEGDLSSLFVAELILGVLLLGAYLFFSLLSSARNRPAASAVPSVPQRASGEGVARAPSFRKRPDLEALSRMEPRRSVVEGYVTFRDLLDGFGCKGRLGQTADEFLASLPPYLDILREPAEALTSLFDVARFSPQVIGTGERREAVAALERIVFALERGDGHERGHR
ncbi:DUF4129 domain-containing protein [Aminirod propionatiphilus]|uniref:DUF4129 domain-containing protein n=1 Tax=Aminirod propionatiphilus TaxID=3415223 RepID=A0ACD1DVS0_9BACT|nr:DUF4129 domain-containing protein [Synergistota bacterium]